MRLASFVVKGRASWGVLDKEDVLDVGAALGDRAPMLRAALGLGHLAGTVEATSA
jgi:hypothetical protein